MAEVLKLSFKNDSYWNTIPLSYFMINFYFILENFERAIDWLDFFIKNNNLNEEKYYKDIRKYFVCKKEKIDLQKVFNKDVAECIEKDFANIDTIFQVLTFHNVQIVLSVI